MISRKSDINDLESLVDIHMEAFPGFFLTSLGRSFLRQYYKAFYGNPECISICAINEELKVVGFCVGTTNSSGFHKRLILKNKSGFFIQFVKILFRKPVSLIRLFGNLEKKTICLTNGPVAELLSIGVRRTSQGTGIGEMLLKQFEEELNYLNSSFVSLTTDYFNNDKVINFYLKAGYEVFNDFVTYPNRKMYKMIKKLV